MVFLEQRVCGARRGHRSHAQGAVGRRPARRARNSSGFRGSSTGPTGLTGPTGSVNITGPAGPTGPTGLLLYPALQPVGVGTGVTGPYLISGTYSATGPYNFALGSAWTFYNSQGGPIGPPGPISATVFFPPIVDPQIPGAVFWKPSMGNTGLFVSPGIFGGG